MKGSLRVIVQNKRIKYDFSIRRNITIIKGDSATGKTSLIEMIRDYYLQGEESGVELFCAKQCVVVEGNMWKEQISHIRQSIVFIDEGNHFMSSVEFAKYIQGTDNYYVLVTREGLSALPYSVEEIYGIRTSEKYGGFTQTYNELYRIYKRDTNSTMNITKVITEDSNSGFQFFEYICRDEEVECISAAGKSNIFREILNNRDDNLLVIADGAAFGSEMEKVMRLVREYKNVTLYLPESFEWMILTSKVIQDKEIKVMSENWGEYIESGKFFSWEQFFSALLTVKTKDMYLQYNKKNINPSYLKGEIPDKILKVMEGIDLRK